MRKIIQEIKCFFCRHKNTSWYKKQSKFQSISGETHYKFCEDCGKQLDKRHLKYEGMGFK